MRFGPKSRSAGFVANLLNRLGGLADVFGQNARSAWSLQSSMGLRRDQAETIPELQRREAVAQYELYRTPFMVKVPELAFPDKPGEQELRPRAEDVPAQTEWSEYLPEPGRAAPLLVATALGPDELAEDACS